MAGSIPFSSSRSACGHPTPFASQSWLIRYLLQIRSASSQRNGVLPYSTLASLSRVIPTSYAKADCGHSMRSRNSLIRAPIAASDLDINPLFFATPEDSCEKKISNEVLTQSWDLCICHREWERSRQQTRLIGLSALLPPRVPLASRANTRGWFGSVKGPRQGFWRSFGPKLVNKTRELNDCPPTSNRSTGVR